MNDKLEKQLKQLLPYIIIIGVLFLLLPLFMRKSEGPATYIIQIGVFPLTAIGCGVFYKMFNRHNNIFLCLIAPLFYALTALLYGMWHDWYNVLVYIAAYFLCGYLGLMLGDILPFGKPKPTAEGGAAKPAKPPKMQWLRARRVKVEEEAPAAETLQTEDPEEDHTLDTSTTDDDIEAILNSIHSRKS